MRFRNAMKDKLCIKTVLYVFDVVVKGTLALVFSCIVLR